MKSTNRIHLLDTIRGVLIIGMVLYHFTFDLVFLFDIPFDLLFHPFTNFIRDFGAGTFIFISGIASNLSRSNLKRGLQCFGAAMLLSLITFFFVPDEFIFFGILHFLGLSMIAYHFYGKYIKKAPIWLAGIFGVIFLLLFQLSRGYIGIFGISLISFPNFVSDHLLFYCIGIPYTGMLHSADYFPILPWIFIFLVGNILGKAFKEGKIPLFFYKDYCHPVSVVGTKTIYIYMLHQPIIYGIMTGIFYILNRA